MKKKGPNKYHVVYWGYRGGMDQQLIITLEMTSHKILLSFPCDYINLKTKNGCMVANSHSVLYMFIAALILKPIKIHWLRMNKMLRVLGQKEGPTPNSLWSTNQIWFLITYHCCRSIKYDLITVVGKSQLLCSFKWLAV